MKQLGCITVQIGGDSTTWYQSIASINPDELEVDIEPLIGTSQPLPPVQHVQGNLTVTGTVTANDYVRAGLQGDWAESYPSSEPVSSHQVVGLHCHATGPCTISLNTRDAIRIGIVSEAPSFVGNVTGGTASVTVTFPNWPGQVRVLVNGPFRAGCQLQASGKGDGMAVVYQPGSQASILGTVIGDVGGDQVCLPRVATIFLGPPPAHPSGAAFTPGLAISTRVIRIQMLAVVGVAVGAIVGGGVAVPAVMMLLLAAGFGPSGIVKKSFAAAMMSAEAKISGGTVAAGGMTAKLQGVGATGLTAGAAAGVAVVGGAAGAVFIAALIIIMCHWRAPVCRR